MKFNQVLNKFKRRKSGYLPILFEASLKQATREHGLDELRKKAEQIVPDISEQYSLFTTSETYLLMKVRQQHAFQLSLIKLVIDEFSDLQIVDIGDFAGTHLQYILSLWGKERNIKCLSVNLDKKVVEKIKAKGLDAIYARAEEFSQYDVKADIFLCFEMLEHMLDPCRFLHDLSTKTEVKYLIVTVPYVAQSRVGLRCLREGIQDSYGAEGTHIFELFADDWKLIFEFSGWRVDHEDIYTQYPRKHFLGLTKTLLRKFD